MWQQTLTQQLHQHRVGKTQEAETWEKQSKNQEQRTTSLHCSGLGVSKLSHRTSVYHRCWMRETISNSVTMEEDSEETKRTWVLAVTHSWDLQLTLTCSSLCHPLAREAVALIISTPNQARTIRQRIWLSLWIASTKQLAHSYRVVMYSTMSIEDAITRSTTSAGSWTSTYLWTRPSAGLMGT